MKQGWRLSEVERRCYARGYFNLHVLMMHRQSKCHMCQRSEAQNAGVEVHTCRFSIAESSD